MVIESLTDGQGKITLKSGATDRTLFNYRYVIHFVIKKSTDEIIGY